MATRMQQRRGTAAQWTSANPILAAGEIGFETDTGKFKVGNGSSTWSSLKYFTDAESVLGGLSGVDLPATLDTLNELAAALGDNPNFLSDIASNLDDHASETENIHGIANTADLATQDYVISAITNSAVDQSELAGTGIDWNSGTSQFDIDNTVVTLDGSQTLTNKSLTSPTLTGTPVAPTADVATNTTQVATTAYVQNAIANVIDNAPGAIDTLNELAAALGEDPNFATTVTNELATKATITQLTDHSADTTSVHGIANTADLAVHSDITTAISDHAGDTTSVHGIANTADLVYASDLSNHASDTTSIHGIANTADLAVHSDISTAITNHNSDETNVHGIADTAQLATKNYADTAVSTHSSDTTNVHGILDTADLALTSDVTDAISTHNSETLNVHGIGNTANLATKTYADDAVSTHSSDTTSVHGIADTANLVLTDDARLSDTRTPTDNTVSTEKIINSAVTADKIAGDAVTTAKILDGAVTSGKIADGTIVNADINASAAIAQSKISGLTSDLAAKAPLADPTFTGTVSGITKSMVGLGNVDNTSDANKPVSTATQTALDLKAPKAAPTFTGTLTAADVTVTGNLTVSGTTTTVSAANLVVSDPLIYLGDGNTGNTVDLGFVGSYNDGTYAHQGLVKDSSDGKWKLFKGVTDEPTTTVNFAQGSLDALKVGAFEATTVTPSSGVVFSDGTQTKEGVPSRTTIVQKTDSYTLSALTERDNFIEVNKATATTITIPTNATVAYPVGTSIDILQVGAGQVTIAGAAGVTVNATPGLKLRTQWSSATLFKRATDTWVVMGDLSA
jgi:hypothetical protein